MKDNNIESRSLSGFGRRARPIILAGLLLLYGCGGMQPKPTYFPKEGDPNTLTYVENGKRKTVCNLNGIHFLNNWSHFFYQYFSRWLSWRFSIDTNNWLSIRLSNMNPWIAPAKF